MPAGIVYRRNLPWNLHAAEKRTSWATAIGAIPGAMPPLIGWVAAGGSLNLEAWVLFAVMVLWQFPHFLAIAWMYREDYSRAGLRMIPDGDASDGKRTYLRVILSALALLPVSLLPAALGLSGITYLFGAVMLGFCLSKFACGPRIQKQMFAPNG